jgi:hypothetical protein
MDRSNTYQRDIMQTNTLDWYVSAVQGTITQLTNAVISPTPHITSVI